MMVAALQTVVQTRSEVRCYGWYIEQLCFLCALRLHCLGIHNVNDLLTLENCLDGTLSNSYMHCYITSHSHFIDLSVRPMAVDVKPVVYYNSLLMSSRVIVKHRTHSLNNKRQYDTFIK